MLGARLFSYFRHWKCFKQFKDIQINIKLKENIIKIYRSNLLYGFLKFKNFTNKVQIKRKKIHIETL